MTMPIALPVARPGSVPLSTRRQLIAGAAALGGLALLPGCASPAAPLSLEEAVRRLLLVATENAFARLTAPGGLWDEQIARLDLPALLGGRGEVLARILGSERIRTQLEARLADLAIDASYRAAPVVADAVRVIGVRNALAIIRGGPDAASAYLRAEMGSALIDAMLPELGEALRLSRDPLIGDVVALLAGPEAAGMAERFGRAIEDAIWTAIAREEAAIRADPEATRDPLLIGVFGVGRRL